MEIIMIWLEILIFSLLEFGIQKSIDDFGTECRPEKRENED